MQVGNLLAYDSVGQTTHRLDVEYADARRATGIGLIFFWRRASARVAAKNRLLFRLHLTKIHAGYDIPCIPSPPVPVHMHQPTVIFRLDMRLGIDKQTYRQNSGRRGVILISNRFRRQKRTS